MELNKLTTEQKELYNSAVKAATDFNKAAPIENELALVDNVQLNNLIEQNKAFAGVFFKLAPIIEGFTGTTDIMGIIPQLLPLVQGLAQDAELKANLSTILVKK